MSANTRSVLFCALMCAAHVAAASAQTQPSADEANRAIKRAMEKTRSVYQNAMVQYLPPGSCNELAGQDCFGGQRECLDCENWPTRVEMEGLAAFYDSTAAFVARADSASHHLLDWLMGQRIGVWARLGLLGVAGKAVDQCSAYAWWCDALHGYVEHLNSNFVRAEWYFRSALRAMPPDISCFWNEITLFSDTMGPSVHFFGGRGHCAPLEEHEPFWTLADPLWTDWGNDRLTEHFARHVDLRIHEQWLASVLNRGWPPSTTRDHPLRHHSELLRYGQPTGYEDWGGKRQLIYGDQAQSYIMLMPIAEAFHAPPETFTPVTKQKAEGYRPPFGNVEAIPLQYGFFLRGGRPLLLVRSEAPPWSQTSDSSTWRSRSWNGSEFNDGVVDVRDNQLTVWFNTAWASQIVSLEAKQRSGAIRARSGASPPDTTAVPLLSSVVVLDGPPDSIRTLQDAALRMRSSHVLKRTEPVSLYWEIYTERAFTARVAMTVTPLARGSFLARLVGREAAPAARIEWTEDVAPNSGTFRKAIRFEALNLPPGAFRVSIHVHTSDGRPIASHTRLLLE